MALPGPASWACRTGQAAADLCSVAEGAAGSWWPEAVGDGPGKETRGWLTRGAAESLGTERLLCLEGRERASLEDLRPGWRFT